MDAYILGTLEGVPADTVTDRGWGEGGGPGGPDPLSDLTLA